MGIEDEGDHEGRRWRTWVAMGDGRKGGRGQPLNRV